MEIAFDLILGLTAVGLSVLLALFGLATWQKCSWPLQLLSIYVSYIGVSNLVSTYLAYQGIRNLFLFHLFILIAVPFLVYIFSVLLSGPPQRFTRLLIPMIIISHLVSNLGNDESFSNPPVQSLAIVSVLITLLALYSLFDTLRSPERDSIFSDERYWISMGSFIYFAGNAFVYSSILGEISMNTWRFHNIIHIVSFFIYLGGYLWKRPAFSFS